MSKDNKYDQFCKAIDSIADKKLITNFVVINEYDANANIDYGKLIRARYPYIKFIQKSASQQGQARTLNMFLKMIDKYVFWIHWEESWIAIAPFIQKSKLILDNDTLITQLQLTYDWQDVGDRLQQKDGYQIVNLDKEYFNIQHDVYRYDELVEQYGIGTIWPIYSLRPSFNRVSRYKNIPAFNEDPELWPVRFEYEYGMKWVDAGSVKAIIQPTVAIRQENHVSTYK
jgi:hypothetical protein